LILLDTHIWVWWVSGANDLSPRLRELIDQNLADGLDLSVISCWEVAKLVEKLRLALDQPTLDWIATALRYPSVTLLPLTPEIAVESTTLPGVFHSDPADQIIVATARTLGLPLLTADNKILNYAHVVSLR
jgi:PIN domain nuclease of toxin-antitoxin system